MKAARELIEEGGPGAVTMESVAARAGVGKPTVYRWWPDRHAVTMAALMDAPTQPARGSTRRSALSALLDQLKEIGARFGTPTGRHIASMLATADRDSELAKAFRGHFVLARRAEGRELIERAIAQHELRKDIDVDVLLDMLYGAVFFRLLMGHAPLSPTFFEKLLAGIDK